MLVVFEKSEECIDLNGGPPFSDAATANCGGKDIMFKNACLKQVSNKTFVIKVF